MRYLIRFSYDGTNFSGYQKQKGKRTIQEEMEKVLQSINNGVYTKLESSGRTDKGVHALCQVAHADIGESIYIDECITEEKLKRAMNSLLPPDIHVIYTLMVEPEFHARYGVKEKEYKYFLNMAEYNPTKRNYCYQYNRFLDVKSMQKAIKYFIGEHDFESFTPTVDKRKNNVRTITKATLEDHHDGILEFTFRGNGFLKYQVRNMVGYLIKVGEGKRKGSDIPKILDGKDRRLASITAHPEGLYLTDVKY